MILYPEKYHYACLGNESASDLLRICGEDLEPSEHETVLKMQNGNKLNFKNHINSLFSRASQKLETLQRI